MWLVGRYQSTSEKSAIAKSLLSTLTLWCLIQIGLGLALGSLHQFALRPVLAAETTLAIAGVLLLSSSPKARASEGHWRMPLARPQLQPGEMFILAALGFTALVLLHRIATQPFTNYDTLWFHGPIVARWYQTASLSQLDPLGNWIIQHPDAQGYPYNWHVLSVFCLLPWGQDLFMALPMLLAWAMLGLSIYLLSREGGADRIYALAAAVLVLVMPFLLNHVTTLHIDLPLAAIYTVSLYYCVAYHHTRQGWQAFLCLASAGLLAGIKTPGLVYAALVIGLLGLSLGLAWLRGGASRQRSYLTRGTSVGKADAPAVAKPRSGTALIWLGLVAGLGLGGFWYLSNGLSVGSLSASNLVAQAPGLPPQAETVSQLQRLWQPASDLQSTTLTAQFHWHNPSHWGILGSQALVRLQLPLLALAGPVLLVPYAWLKSPTPQSRQRLIGLFGLFVITAFLYWNTPYSAGGDLSPLAGFNLRYGFPALGLLAAVAALCASRLRLPQRWVTATVLVSSILGIVSSTIFDQIRTQSIVGLQAFWPSQLVDQLRREPGEAIATLWPLITGLGLTASLTYLTLFLGLCGLCLIGVRRPPRPAPLLRPWPRALALLLSAVVLVTVTGQWQQARAANRQLVYRGIDDAIAQLQPGQRIAYFSSAQSYLLYGKQLDQAVLHLPPDTDAADWVESLRQANVALVATGPNPPSASRAAVFSSVTVPQGPLVPLSGDSSDRRLRLYQLIQP
ncbi:phospholipid carrier-dependent glycosyltransferase [Nodosilinea sp. PGN35]|uniref:phospholipid carrier-dependent glycosyltransferase n=1 Tax=Nodosilinea sp. PGN35 TaxID=3020489 RepID=UPI0023B35629|nr:phospholipid carrier-dependent glycosyltransferase [Nodosilinea sp. TSF1-S3]